MPRDAPVTSASFPSSEQKLTSRGEGPLRLLEALEVVDRDGVHAAVDPPHEAAQDVSRTHLDERADTLPHQLARGLREAHGRGQLIDEQARQALGGLDLR